jgi:hypothetical protein
MLRAAAPMSAPLSARYRRPLTFGAVLDETVQLFRRRWLTLLAIQLATLVPYVLVLALFGGLGFLALSNNSAAVAQAAATNPAALASVVATALGGGLVLALLLVVCQLVAHAAGVLTIDAAMRADERSAGSALGSALPRLWALLGAGLLIFLRVLGLTILSLPLMLLSPLLPLTLVALIVWAASPSARRPWLEWFIILTTPFGLVVYYVIRWSLYVAPVMLEQLGPLGGVRRSAELVSGRWFRTCGVLVVVGLIATILQAIPSAIIGLVLGIVLVGSRQPDLGTNVVVQVVNNAVGLIGWVLFGGLVFAGTTLLYHDLRNRREGADLAERLELLEAQPAPDAG